ncbi:hypothetical protein D3C81_1856670 [compost metagenome]
MSSNNYTLVTSNGESIRCEICDKAIGKGEEYWSSKVGYIINQGNQHTGSKKNYATCLSCK